MSDGLQLYCSILYISSLLLYLLNLTVPLSGLCAFLDIENAMEFSVEESLCINPKNLLISRPNSAENMLCAVDTLTKSGSLDVIVVDSVSD